MKRFSLKSIQILILLRTFFVIAGVFFTGCLLLAFTTLPFWGYHWLGTSCSELKWKPETIILLGGGGMPSESNLMRSWYVAQAAASFPESRVIVAMPGDTTNPASTPRLMQQELEVRGLAAGRISIENSGTNTRAQALLCARMSSPSDAILLVTSPEHMRRAVLCFRKAGFEKVNALPAFENAAEADLTFRDDHLGGKQLPLPAVGRHLSVRYQVWSHLKYEILIAREMTALAYYKLRGWI